MKHPPIPFFLLTSSVGYCGTNNASEVKILQQAIMDSGYKIATGRSVDVNGRCTQEAIDAIRFYQRALSRSPTGLIGPGDFWFHQAIRQAITPQWRPMHVAGPLRVSEGQVTFDAEGQDYLTGVIPLRQPARMPYFSRILHYPGGNSGVTLGRGYDMSQRSAGAIFSTLRQAGIEEYKAVLCARAAYLRGRHAQQFVRLYGWLVGEISH